MNYALLTRTRQENLKLSREIQHKGIATAFLPLLILREIPINWDLLKGYCHLVVTSKFAAQIIARNNKHKIMALCVGGNSARILAQNSSIKIAKVFNNASDLTTYLEQNSSKIKGAYVSGDVIKGGMPNFIDRYIAYNTTYTSKIPDIVKKQLINMEIKVVMLYSENSAKIFLDLCHKNSIISYLSTITAVVISQSIKSIVSDYFKKTYFCHEPDNKLMLKLVYNIYENSL